MEFVLCSGCVPENGQAPSQLRTMESNRYHGLHIKLKCTPRERTNNIREWEGDDANGSSSQTLVVGRTDCSPR